MTRNYVDAGHGFMQPEQRGKLAEYGRAIFLDRELRYKTRTFSLHFDIAKMPGDIPYEEKLFSVPGLNSSSKRRPPPRAVHKPQ
jgi:hypothetical protein